MAVMQIERRLWKTWRQAVEDGGDTRRGSEDRWTVSGFGPQNPGKDSGGNRGGEPEEIEGQVAGSRSLRRGEAKLWSRRVRLMLREKVGQKCPGRVIGLVIMVGVI